VSRLLDAATVMGGVAVLVLVLSVVTRQVRSVNLIAAQGLLPYLGMIAPGVLVVALIRRRTRQAALAAVATVAYLAVTVPASRGGDPPRWAADAPTFTLFSANVRFDNPRREEVARDVIAADADVVILNETTPAQRAALREAGIDRLYPYRSHTPDAAHYGDMILSRLPTTDLDNESVGILELPAVTVTVGDSAIRVYATHLSSPDTTASRQEWLDQFDALSELVGTARTDLVVAGDLNASPFHPPLRRLIDRGLTDAHGATGQGLVPSWAPAMVPSFLSGRVMRLDHSLSTEGVAPLTVADRDVTGSDHRSMTVTYAVRQTTR
jgi:vancomycin resistance protein VanJ